ncbi:MAG: GNAT family N-acetyltransferase [Actinomycetales bacterium]|nr:GNAT family N-acetyltransferase [Actinomycetales bacterium]
MTSTPEKPAVIVRKARASDFDAWLVLWQNYLVFYEEDLPRSTTDLSWSRLLDEAVNMTGLVAEVDDRLVGFTNYLFTDSTWHVNPSCYLEDLYVLDDVRGLGVGRTLIAAVTDIARLAGSDTVYWQTQNTNVQARTLYDKVASDNGHMLYEISLSS